MSAMRAQKRENKAEREICQWGTVGWLGTKTGHQVESLRSRARVAEPPECSGATAESADWEMEGRDPESAKRNVVGLTGR